MKKLKQKGLPSFLSGERQKIFIRLDRHLQRLPLSGFLKRIWKEWKIPKNGFKNVTDLERWQKEKIFNSRGGVEKWQNTLQKALYCAKLQKTYLNTIEDFILLNIQSAPVGLPGIPHHRTDKTYLRARKLTELARLTNPETSKKITLSEVAELYSPNYPVVLAPCSSSSEWKNKFKIKNPATREDYFQPIKEYSKGKYDRWLDQNGVFTGVQVSKIISKYKKILLG